MKRSTDRILTTHVGSLARPPELAEMSRNVQTADERAKLVYRVKVTVDNRQGILKPGMPVEVDLGLPAR